MVLDGFSLFVSHAEEDFVVLIRVDHEGDFLPLGVEVVEEDLVPVEGKQGLDKDGRDREKREKEGDDPGSHLALEGISFAELALLLLLEAVLGKAYIGIRLQVA